MSFTTLLAMFLDWLGSHETEEPVEITLLPEISPLG